MAIPMREVALGATFLAAAAAAVSLGLWREAHHGALARRLDAIGAAGGGRESAAVRSGAETGAPRAEGEGAPEDGSARRWRLQLGGGALDWLRRRRDERGAAEVASRDDPLPALLRQAGVRLRPEEYRALVAALAAAVGLAGMFRLGVFGAAIGLGIGGTLPRLWVRSRVVARRRTFAEQLPDALSLMSNALRSGHSFLQAAELCGEELPEPAGPEWKRVIYETRVNIPLEDALSNLLGRVGSDDLDLMITGVLIQRQVGGNLAEVLDRSAETLRQRVRLRGEVRALTAQGRLSGWIVGLLPAGLLILVSLINPDYVQPMLAPGFGRDLMVVAAFFEGIGALLIRRLVHLEY